MQADWTFWTAAVGAVLIAGISKAGFGGGVGVAAVPLIALTVPVPTAAAIMLPILCLMDLMNVAAYRGKWDRRNLMILLPAACVGIVIGSLLFGLVSDAVLRLLIGTVAVGFAFNHWLRAAATTQSAQPRNIVKGGFWGGIAGFTSFLAHAGGPPLSIYLLPLKLEKTVFQATTVVFFTVVNQVKLIPYGVLGQLSVDNLTTSAVLFPVAILGTLLGVRLHYLVPQDLFFRLAYIFVAVTGGKLLWDGVRGVLAG